MEKNILITGSNGQIGKELAESFIQKNTSSNIICLDLIMKGQDILLLVKVVF